MFKKTPSTSIVKDEEVLSGLSWEADVVLNERKSRQLAWRITSVSILLVVMMAAAIMLMLPLRKVVPYVIQVDRLTGATQVVQRGADFVTSTTMNQKFWIKSFLIAHERYVYKLLQVDYDNMKLLSGDRVWSSYRGQFEGSGALDERFKDDIEVIPEILSITLSGEGLATVRYELRTRDFRSASPASVTRRVATLRYEFKPDLLTVESVAIANPFGFAVVSFQSDPETMTAPPAAAAATTTGVAN